MEQDETSLTIEELAERTQTPVRTVRYYIAEKMLPGPGARGKGASYTEEHLLRLRLIRRLTERRAPLAEIREVMAGVTDADVRALLAEEDARTQTLERAELAISPRDYISALLDQARQTKSLPKPSTTPPASMARGQVERGSAWRRIELAPGVELHLLEKLEERNRSLIDRLLAASKGLWGK
ncbi:MAG TPA: MerR family transcriptional regulator [Ktedonobacterales bacterium]